MTMAMAAMMVSSLGAFMKLSGQQGVRQSRAYAETLRRGAVRIAADHGHWCSFAPRRANPHVDVDVRSIRRTIGFPVASIFFIVDGLR